MNIDLENLKTSWYEDKDGNRIEGGTEFDEARPANAFYYSNISPCVTDHHYRIANAEDVCHCKHPRKYIKPTYGWIDKYKGRECTLCGGTQVKRKGLFHRWPKKWNSGSMKEIFTGESSWNEDLVLAMANSGDYTLKQAMIVCSLACERCINVLAHKYGLDYGYEEFSEDWKKAHTSCQFCENEDE